MKPPIPSIALALLVSCPVGAVAQNALENDPGYLNIDKAIDLKTVRADFNVNLPRFLLKDAASFFNGGPGDPFAEAGINFADLTKDIKLIRLVVFDPRDNKDTVEKGLKALRAELEAKWTPIFTTMKEERVEIYMRSEPAGESMAGLALIVQDSGAAVIANVVGKVSIRKVIEIASHPDKLPKDLLPKGLLNQPDVAVPAVSPSQEKSKPATEKAPPSATK